MARYWEEYRRGSHYAGGREQRPSRYDWLYRRGTGPSREEEFGPEEYGREYRSQGRRGRGLREYGGEFRERRVGWHGYGEDYSLGWPERREGRRRGGRGRFGERGAYYGYEEEYSGRRGRRRMGGEFYGEELYGPAEPPVEERYGRTPPDRWPGVGHDLRAQRNASRLMNDEDIRDAVLENLFQDEWIDPDRIEVDVEDGVVHLSGEVNDFMEARYAWDDAWETPGVRGVINNLTVRTDVPHRSMDMPQTTGGTRRRSMRGGR